jgi:hypothetical protein
LGVRSVHGGGLVEQLCQWLIKQVLPEWLTKQVLTEWLTGCDRRCWCRQTREEEIRVYKKKVERQDASDSVDMSERQPVFLKDKGDAMFRQGNFR